MYLVEVLMLRYLLLSLPNNVVIDMCVSDALVLCNNDMGQMCCTSSMFPLREIHLRAAAKTPQTQAAWLRAASLVILCAKSTCVCSCGRRVYVQPSARLMHKKKKEEEDFA